MKKRTMVGEGGVTLSYTIDDYTDPWSNPQTVVLVHGLAESGEAWRGWVSHLARRYRVVRLDQRGYGASAAVSEDHPWSLDLLVGDLAQLIREVAAGSVHLIGAKIGATVCARFAAAYPHTLKTLTLVGLPVTGPKKRMGPDPLEVGVLGWARATMRERLGNSASPAMLEWWSQLMGRTALSTFMGFTRAVGGFDVRADLPRIACPVLLLNSDSATHPLSGSTGWRSTLRNVQMTIVPGDGFHAAATQPDFCAQTALEFMMAHDVHADVPSTAGRVV